MEHVVRVSVGSVGGKKREVFGSMEHKTKTSLKRNAVFPRWRNFNLVSKKSSRHGNSGTRKGWNCAWDNGCEWDRWCEPTEPAHNGARGAPNWNGEPSFMKTTLCFFNFVFFVFLCELSRHISRNVFIGNRPHCYQLPCGAPLHFLNSD